MESFLKANSSKDQSFQNSYRKDSKLIWKNSNLKFRSNKGKTTTTQAHHLSKDRTKTRITIEEDQEGKIKMKEIMQWTMTVITSSLRLNSKVINKTIWKKHMRKQWENSILFDI